MSTKTFHCPKTFDSWIWAKREREFLDMMRFNRNAVMAEFSMPGYWRAPKYLEPLFSDPNNPRRLTYSKGDS